MYEYYGVGEKKILKPESNVKVYNRFIYIIN